MIILYKRLFSRGLGERKLFIYIPKAIFESFFSRLANQASRHTFNQ